MRVIIENKVAHFYWDTMYTCIWHDGGWWECRQSVMCWPKSVCYANIVSYTLTRLLTVQQTVLTPDRRICQSSSSSELEASSWLFKDSVNPSVNECDLGWSWSRSDAMWRWDDVSGCDRSQSWMLLLLSLFRSPLLAARSVVKYHTLHCVDLQYRSWLTLCQLVISEIGDRLWQVNYLAILPSPRSTQPFIPAGTLNLVPALTGVKCRKVTAAGWQITTVWSHMARDFP